MTDRDYEDVTAYQLDQAGEAELLARQIECTFIWSNSAGHPLGVIMNYVFRDGRFWLTASSQRARVPAVRRDPRVSIVLTSRGSGITTSKSLTYKGRCIVHQDQAIKDWFYPALAAAVRPADPDAQEAFVRHLDSPRRVVLEVVPEGRIGFDSAQMWRDTPDAARRELASPPRPARQAGPAAVGSPPGPSAGARHPGEPRQCHIGVVLTTAMPHRRG
jgi:general stress protein 26